MVGVIDYGAGNLCNVEAALSRLGISIRRVTTAAELGHVDAVVLPGVGRFGPAVARLQAAGLWEPLKDWGRSGRPLLGICLGMQLLFEGSDEDPGVAGLGLISGSVTTLNAPLVPHIGWAPVMLCSTTLPGWDSVVPCFHAYFAHSFAVPPGHPAATAEVAYPAPFTAAVQAGAVCGLQFHPEKSGRDGLALLDGLVRTMKRGPAFDAGAALGSTRARQQHQGSCAPPSTRRGRPHRVIPCLDIKDGRVVKGVRFRNLRDAGDPVERARTYDADGADEVCLLDVSASQEARQPLYELVARVASELSVPLSVGGGIRSLDEMRNLLLAGADRVSLGTAAVELPDLVRDAAERFGRQFVIVSIDARTCGDRLEVLTHGGTRPTGIDAVRFAQHVVELGAGEILFNAIDADGTRAGYDVAHTRAIADAVSVPVIASGGAGTPEDLVRVLHEGHADAVLAASIFHDGVVTVREVKAALSRSGVEVRL